MSERGRPRPLETELRVVTPAEPGDAVARQPRGPAAFVRTVAGEGLTLRSRLWHLLRQRAVLASFVIVAILPAVVAAGYFYGIASDQYVAETRFGVRTPDVRSGDASPVFQGMAAASQIGLDSYVVVQFIQSRDFVDRLQERVPLRALYAQAGIDPLARLSADASAERLVDYWRGMVDPFFDLTNGTIVVRVRAFSPADARLLANEIQALSEALIAELTARLRGETLSMAESELARAEARLKGVLAAREQLRAREGVIDPGRIADATRQAAGRLREDVGKDKAELGALLRKGLGEGAPVVINLRSRIASLEQEIRVIELHSSASQTQQATLSQATTSFEGLASEQHIAEKALSSAIESLERARATAGRQGSYLVAFVRPGLPEEALYPRRARSVLVVFIAGFALWAIGWLAIASIREHL
jgi:capsular polysaccharide transport system permease protein